MIAERPRRAESGCEPLRLAVRDFARGRVQPLAAQIDRTAEMPAAVLGGLRELDLMGIVVPAEYGGAGLDQVAFVTCVEELARACASTAALVDIQNTVACQPILIHGDEAQRRAWLPRLASGAILGAFALTEPAAGSDVGAMQSTARRDGDAYVIDGRKIFITNAGLAGLYVVTARTGVAGGAGLSTFLVPADTPGVRSGQVFEKLGLNGSTTGELLLDGVRVPASARLSQEGRGLRIAMTTLDYGRIGIAAQALGIAGAALDEALAYTTERRQFGQPVASFQGVQFMLADMATRLRAASLLTYEAARLASDGRPFTLDASMAKLFATDAAMEVATNALQLAGGYGYLKDLPFERHFRDAKALQIYEGTNQVQRMVIGRQLLAS